MSSLAYGVGFNSGGKHKANIDNSNKKRRVYYVWRTMLERCYCEKSLAKRPTYIGCTVHPDWHDYQVFAEWYNSQEFNGEGYCLDKDLLLVNNRVYHPNGCCLIPQSVNKLLNGYYRGRGELMIGVHLKKATGKYGATIGVNGVKKHIGYFDCEIKAHRAYIEAKTANIIEVAEEWKESMDSRAYSALINWSFDERSSEIKWS